LLLFQFVYFVADLPEQVGNGLIGIAPYAVQERVTRFGVQFDAGNTGAILPAVVLLFHQQVQLIQSIQYGVMLLLVVTERLAEADESQAAFVFDWIAHARDFSW
jgi:hypothetical protein